jgi:hypothetical protein
VLLAKLSGLNRHRKNFSHVVVKNGLLAAIVPFDGYARPVRFNDGALIVPIVMPANAVADVELSGLVAGHFACILIVTTLHRGASATKKLSPSIY